jgi:glycosyltransferase involved in cell wall biosynthesis
MRVALNLEQLLNRPPGGIGRYTAELARLLPVPHEGGEPFDVVPFVARHRRAEIERVLGAFGLPDLDPVRLPLPRPVLYDSWNLLGFPPLKLLSSRIRNVDLVHAPSLAVPPRSGVPLIVTVHDAAAIVYPETYPRRGRWFHAAGSNAAARRADVVIAPTIAAADEISARTAIARDRIRVIPHGVTQRAVGEGLVAATRATLGIGEEPFILWVGTLEPRKNVPVLVEAFRLIVKERDLPHKLVMVGPSGWLDTAETIREPVEALGDRVHITGPIRADRLLALYRGADLFAFPSLHEGFGLPVLEAMAQSTAVVCADIPVLHEIAGDAARYASPQDPEVWADVITALLRDDDERENLSRAGRVRAAAFTWERCIDRTRAVYRDVLGLS